MTQTSFIETEEQQALRKAVAAMAANYGQDYYLEKARAGQHTDELWNEAGKLGFIGVNLPEEYGGGGAGMYELSLVMEEMAAAGSPLLLMVVSPAINGTIISKFGTDDQKKRWLPGIADGSITMAFAITEPDAGPTRIASPPPPAATAAIGSCRARRCSSPASTRRRRCSSWGVPPSPAQEPSPNHSALRCSSCPPTPPD